MCLHSKRFFAEVREIITPFELKSFTVDDRNQHSPISSFLPVLKCDEVTISIGHVVLNHGLGDDG